MAFYVKDEYRTNPISLREGGFDVQLFFKEGAPRIYKRVKNPGAFYMKAKRENPGKIGHYRILGESE